MFDKAYFNGLKKRIAPYLEPDEELLSVTPAEPAGMLKGYIFAGELGAQIKGRKLAGQDSTGEIRLAANMSLAVTTRRVLLFHFGMGRQPKPEFLLGSIPVADAEIRLGGKGKLGTKPYTLLVSGTPYELEARKAVRTDLIVSALEQARSGMRAA